MLLPAVIVTAMLAYAPAAWATNRYVGVGGSTTDTTCTDAAHPCDLVHVVKTVASQGDDVTVEPGTYNVSGSLSIDNAMTIHGQDGFQRPTINVGQMSDAPTVGTPALRYLDLEMPDGNMFFGRGVFEQLTIDGGGNVCELSGTVVFRDNVCVANEAGAAIYAETNGGVETMDLYNDTAIATAANYAAIHVGTQVTGGAVTANLVNTIAHAAGGPDLDAKTGAIGNATINTNHSDYATKQTTGPGAAINTSVTDQHGAPVFQPGTYREAANSTATLGKGAVDPSTGTLDFEGDLRTVAGAIDIGADQYVSAAPSITGVLAAGVDGHATVTATIDTHGSPTTYSVQYGPSSPSYGASSSTLGVAASLSPQQVSIPLVGLTPGATYHFRVIASNNSGAATSADGAFTGAVTPPAGNPGGSSGGSGVPAPQVSPLTFNRSVFAARPVRKARGSRATHRPVGAWISYTDSQAAITTLTVSRRRSGFVRGGKCVLSAHRPKGTRRCVRYVSVGAFTHRDTAGRNRLLFSGAVHGRRLAAGSYRMTAVPMNAAHKRGRTRSHAFTIVS